MAADTYDFTGTAAIEQGATFDRTITYTDENGDVVDLTGYIARMQIRKNLKDSDFLIELTVANSRIIITALTGTIRLLIDAADTADLDFSDAVYDLEIEGSDGTVTRLLQGSVELSKEVTRA